MSNQKRSYTFSFGDSTDRGVGVSATIVSTSQKEALERLRLMLPAEIELDLSEHSPHPKESITLVFDGRGVTHADFEDAEDVEE